jgi:maleate isomerase
MTAEPDYMVNDNDVDALVQAGTNLSMVTLADEAECWLGKPVIAINAAIWWIALRDNGVEDKVHGCGRLLRE